MPTWAAIGAEERQPMGKRVSGTTRQHKGKTGSSKRASKQAKKGNLFAMPVLQPDAAGIDVGASEIWVAVPADRAQPSVRCYGSFTCDLRSVAEWLRECGIRTVAMESTGVYWIPLFQILSDAGFELMLVNARHYKNVPGKKTDVVDSQWLQFLLSVGLLRGSHRPEQACCAIRTLLRHRGELVGMAAQHVQHVQKALDQMNVKLTCVLSDVMGITGITIIQAILDGERDPVKLARLRDPRVRATEETIAKALDGDYRPELLVILRQSLELYRVYQNKIDALDKEMEGFMLALPERVDVKEHPLPEMRARKGRVKKQHNAPMFDLRSHCYRALGVDLTEIPGIDEVTAHLVIAEVGADFSKFPSAGAFCSWLGLCPNNEVSGGRVLRSGTRHVQNRLALGLRQAAQTLWANKSIMGDFYRRMKARFGPRRANTITAHKLARIVYHLVTTGQTYTESALHSLEAKQNQYKLARLEREAHERGFRLVPIAAS